MEFPQYRKYKNESSYFKIVDESRFVEYKKTGQRWEIYSFEAKILPDRNYIADLLEANHSYWDKIDQPEFEQFLVKHKLG